MQSDDLWRRADDLARLVRGQKETVGDPGYPEILADQDIHPVAVLTDRVDLHLQELAR